MLQVPAGRAGCALMLEPALTYGQCSGGEDGRGACSAPASAPAAAPAPAPAAVPASAPAPADDLYPPLPSERPPFYLGSATAAPQVPSARTGGRPPARPRAGPRVTGPRRGRSRAPSARTAGRPPSGTTLRPRPGAYIRTRRVRPAPGPAALAPCVQAFLVLLLRSRAGGLESAHDLLTASRLRG